MSVGAEFDEEPLAREALLPADATLAGALERMPSTAAPIFAARRGDEARAVPEHELRLAWLEGMEPETAVFGLMDGRHVARDRAEARVRLAGEPALECLVAFESGAPLLVARRRRRVTKAVVMAGGLGQRLRPLTDGIPKPLLAIAGEPLLGRTLRHLRAHGIETALLSVGYLAEQVRRFAGDGRAFGLSVEYLEERQALGTGAGLVLMRRDGEPFLVVNGDVLTNANLSALGRRHVASGDLVTVAVSIDETRQKYGVVQSSGGRVTAIVEKPVQRHAINAGIYAFSADALGLVPPDEPLPMVPFLNDLIARGHRVGRFGLVEYWNDIGALPDYERAQQDVARLAWPSR